MQADTVRSSEVPGKSGHRVGAPHVEPAGAYTEAEGEIFRISDLVPGDLSLFDGEFAIQGDASFRCTGSTSVGDLRRTDFLFEMNGGRAEYTILGGRNYFAEWGRYRFGRGLALAAWMDRPLVELHFQLEGATPSLQNSLGIDFELHAGQSNLSFLPPLDGSFELKGDADGAAFSIVLSKAFFVDLAGRHPHLLEKCMTRMDREEPFTLRADHFQITPRMRAVIQRIREHDACHGAGSLFLEAQVLELLSLQFAQLERPTPTHNGHLSRSDADRIRAAAGLLIERMDNPPTVVELARYALMNEFKLKQGFREIFGTSPYAYMLEHKLELARMYLLDTDWSIAAISRRVGYRDPAHLTNAFRKRFGMRPSDLR